MKKQIKELSVEEFTRLLCDWPKRYEIDLGTIDENGERDIVIGTYGQLAEVCRPIESIYNWVKENLYDYNTPISDIEIYDYIEEKTRNFDQARSKIVLEEMARVHCMEVHEEKLQHVYDTYNENKWEYPMRKKNHLEILAQPDSDVENIADTDKMFKRVFGIADEFLYNKAIDILKSKIRHNDKMRGRNLSRSEAFDQMDRIHRQCDVIGSYFCRAYGRWPDCAPNSIKKTDMFNVTNYRRQMSVIKLTEQDYENIFEYIKETEDMNSAYSLYYWNWLVHKRIPMLLDDLYRHNDKDAFFRVLNYETGKYNHSFPAIERYQDFLQQLHSWLQDMRNKNCTWDKSRTENLLALGAEEFTIIIEGWQEKCNNNGNLFLYNNLEQTTVYNYLYNKTMGFKPEACVILLQSITKARNSHLDCLHHAAELYYTIPEISYNCTFSDKPEEYFDFAPLLEDGSLDKERCFLDCFGECKDSSLYEYVIKVLNSRIIGNTTNVGTAVSTDDEDGTGHVTPVDFVFKESVQWYKRVAIYKHILENKEIKSSHNYIGAIGIAMKDYKLIANKYLDFSALALALGKAVGFDEKKMNIRATKIGQKHKDNANKFIEQVSKLREPRKP